MEHSKFIPVKAQAKSLNPIKRARRSGGASFYKSDSDSDEDVVAGVWPRWLVVEGADPEKPLEKLDPWAISKGFKGVSSTITNITEMKGRKGALLVECPTKKVSDSLLGRNESIFVDRLIKVTPHRSLNTSRGIIFCRRLDGFSEEDILKNLRSQGVVAVKSFAKKKDNDKDGENNKKESYNERSHPFLLTFALPKVPERISIGYMMRNVKPYIQSPMRCFKCQKFGHTASRCRSEQMTCQQCGHEAHDNACSQEPSCPNCKGSHGPRSKHCPKYKEEIAISKIKSEKNISYLEAKRLYFQSTPAPSTSFAEVAGKFLKTSFAKPKSAECQTQCGGCIPEDIIKQLRGNKWKRVPFVPTPRGKDTNPSTSAPKTAGKGKTQSGSSTTPAPRSQPAGEPTPASRSQPAGTSTPASRSQPAGEKEESSRGVLSAPKLNLNLEKWKAGQKPLRGANPVVSTSQDSPASVSKGKGGGKGKTNSQNAPSRLSKAEKNPTSTHNIYSALSENSGSDDNMEYLSS